MYNDRYNIPLLSRSHLYIHREKREREREMIKSISKEKKEREREIYDFEQANFPRETRRIVKTLSENYFQYQAYDQMLPVYWLAV